MFPEGLFFGVDVEFILGEAEVCSPQARVMIWKGYNFWSDRWIEIKILQEFPEALFHGVDLESLLSEDTVSSRQARVAIRKGS